VGSTSSDMFFEWEEWVVLYCELSHSWEIWSPTAYWPVVIHPHLVALLCSYTAFSVVCIVADGECSNKATAFEQLTNKQLILKIKGQGKKHLLGWSEATLSGQDMQWQKVLFRLCQTNKNPKVVRPPWQWYAIIVQFAMMYS